MALKSFLIIEQDILQDKKLTISEKLVFSFIRGYWRQGEPCSSSNNQFASYLGLSRDKVIKAINHLQLLGYIRIRHLKSLNVDISCNDLRVIEKPTTPQSEQLSLLFKKVIYGKNNKK